MELSLILLNQVTIVFILIAVGFILRKTNTVNETGVKQMANVLLLFVTPSVLIIAYQRDFKAELAMNLLLAAIFALIVHIVMILISTIIYRKKSNGKSRINIFSSIYSNCGYMAVPLLSSVLGDTGVFYGSAYLAIFQILVWTHGITVCSGDIKSLSIKKAFINPGVLGVAISLLLFFTGIKLPEIILEPVKYMAGLNTPLAMLILGSYLANVDFKKTFSKLSIYGVFFLRLILFPVIAFFLAKLMNLQNDVLAANLICASCPVATIATLFASKYDLDAGYASEIVSISTLLSILTIPLVMMLTAI